MEAQPESILNIPGIISHIKSLSVTFVKHNSGLSD